MFAHVWALPQGRQHRLYEEGVPGPSSSLPSMGNDKSMQRLGADLRARKHRRLRERCARPTTGAGAAREGRAALNQSQQPPRWGGRRNGLGWCYSSHRTNSRRLAPVTQAPCSLPSPSTTLATLARGTGGAESRVRCLAGLFKSISRRQVPATHQGL